MHSSHPIPRATLGLAVLILVSTLAAVGAAEGPAASALPSGQLPIEEVVDLLIGRRLEAEGIRPAPLTDDLTLLRRMMLDLVGRPPTADEAREYLADTEPDKRQRWVDRLLATPSYTRHQVDQFESLLMPTGDRSLRPYLEQAWAARRPWDQVVRDLLLAEEPAGEDGVAAATGFVKTRVKDLDLLTNDASVLFFGVNVSCAQCHDHPHVESWTQAHFFGMKSFFSRTFENGGFLGEREYGRVQYKTTAGETRDAQLMFLTGTVVEEPPVEEPSSEALKAEKKLLDDLKSKKQPPPRPGFSRRGQLVEVALRPGEDGYLARAVVNRLIYRLFGQGLVMPLDQMHPENPPSHPELLEWLARDLIAHDYDLNRLIRGLTLSQAYARSSRWEATGERPPVELFAVANVRPLSPMQYAVSLKLASRNPDRWVVEGDGPQATAELEKRVESLAGSARSFASQIEPAGQNFQVGVAEALLTSNSDRFFKEFLAADAGTLVGKLASMSDADPAELVELLVWSTLSRPPAPDEAAALQAYLEQRADRRGEAIEQLVWAILTSSELRFNF